MNVADKNVQGREIWIDNIKVFACVLVVLGHFFQSMTKAEIIPAGDFYRWFNKSIYYFHVPLFFICSGYVYQSHGRIERFNSWWKNMLKKSMSLGVPYFTFSLLTWILKTMFLTSVNSEISGIIETLFVVPVSPYWYLYCLFFIFLITPTFKNKKSAGIGLGAAVFIKGISIFSEGECGIYALSVVFANEIWFVIGMSISVFLGTNIFKRKYSCFWGFCMAILFIICSIVVHHGNVPSMIAFVLGLIACTAVLLIFGYCFRNNVQSWLFGSIAKYTMPIFLMHTIFAAGLRGVLVKIGIENAIIHVALGLTISFFGPILATKIMLKIRGLGFFLYPNKYIKWSFIESKKSIVKS